MFLGSQCDRFSNGYENNFLNFIRPFLTVYVKLFGASNSYGNVGKVVNL